MNTEQLARRLAKLVERLLADLSKTMSNGSTSSCTNVNWSRLYRSRIETK